MLLEPALLVRLYAATEVVGLCILSPLACPLAAGKRQSRSKQAKSSLQAEWGRKTASHPMRRAGFSASLEEADRLVERGFETALNQLLNPEMADDLPAGRSEE